MKGLNYKWILIGGIILFLFSATFISCKKKSDPAPTQGANEVWIQNMAFGPATLTVNANATVNWVNKDSYNHTVSSDSGWFDSGIVGGGGTYSRQFTAAGTYSYHCSIHANMKGKVIVH